MSEYFTQPCTLINLKTTHDSTSILLVQSCLFLLLIIPHSTPVFHLHHHKAIFGMVVQLNGVSSLFHHPFDLFLESKPLKRKYFFTSKFMGSWIILFRHMPWHHRKMYQQQLKGETKTKLGQQTKFIYRIYSINRPGRLLNFCTLRVGAYSRWALIRGWALIKFSTLQQVQYVYFATKQ